MSNNNFNALILSTQCAVIMILIDSHLIFHRPVIIFTLPCPAFIYMYYLFSRLTFLSTRP